MRLVIEKKLNSGKYNVSISVSDYTEDEIDRLSKYGSPFISIEPRSAYFNRQYTNAIPITDLNMTFTFEEEQQATNFSDNIKQRISKAISQLKARTDKFSGEDELVL